MLSQSKTFSILEVELEDVQSRFEKGELNMDSKAAGSGAGLSIPTTLVSFGDLLRTILVFLLLFWLFLLLNTVVAALVVVLAFMLPIFLWSQAKLYTYIASLTWKLDEEAPTSTSGLWKVYQFEDDGMASVFNGLVHENALKRPSKDEVPVSVFVSDPGVLALTGFSLSSGRSLSSPGRKESQRESDRERERERG